MVAMEMKQNLDPFKLTFVIWTNGIPGDKFWENRTKRLGREDLNMESRLRTEALITPTNNFNITQDKIL